MPELPTPGGMHGKGQRRQAIPCIGKYSGLLCGKPTAEDGGISAEISKTRIDRMEERRTKKIPWYGPGQRLGHAQHDIPSKIHRDCGQFEANCKPDREENEGKCGRSGDCSVTDSWRHLRYEFVLDFLPPSIYCRLLTALEQVFFSGLGRFSCPTFDRSVESA